MTWRTTLPEPAVAAAATDRVAAFRRELRGTGAIVAAIVAIIAIGWIGSMLVGRSVWTLGPGVTVDFGAGWGQAFVGPTDLFSTRRHLGEAELVIAPTFDGGTAEGLLESYRDEVVATEATQVTFEKPMPRDHWAGPALIQHWTGTDDVGGRIVGELVIVVRGRTAVILDGRWPATIGSSITDELRRVVDSLVIVPLDP